MPNFRKNLRLPKFFFHQHQDKKIKTGTGEKDDEKGFHKAAQKEHEFIQICDTTRQKCSGKLKLKSGEINSVQQNF
jgi:hypothetical protein